MAIGFLGTTTVNSLGRNGLFYGGDVSLHVDQLVAVVAGGVYAFVATFIIAKVLDMTMGPRLSEDDEMTGLDVALHQEFTSDLSNSVIPFVRQSTSAGVTKTKGKPAKTQEDNDDDGDLMSRIAAVTSPEPNEAVEAARVNERLTHYYGRPLNYEAQPDFGEVIY